MFGAEGETRSLLRCPKSMVAPARRYRFRPLRQFALPVSSTGRGRAHCPRLRRSSSSYSLQTKTSPNAKRHLKMFGAEGETRTLAPVSRPTPLAGAPRHQLEYFCIGNKFNCYLVFKCCKFFLQHLVGAESGIRTHGTLPYDGFQDRSVITTSVSLHLIALIYYHIKA